MENSIVQPTSNNQRIRNLDHPKVLFAMMMLCLACLNGFNLPLVIGFFQTSWVAEISMQNLGRLSLLGKGATVRVSVFRFEIWVRPTSLHDAMSLCTCVPGAGSIGSGIYSSTSRIWSTFTRECGGLAPDAGNGGNCSTVPFGDFLRMIAMNTTFTFVKCLLTAMQGGWRYLKYITRFFFGLHGTCYNSARLDRIKFVVQTRT